MVTLQINITMFNQGLHTYFKQRFCCNLCKYIIKEIFSVCMSTFIIETFLQSILETFVLKENWHDYALDLLLELNQLLQCAFLYRASTTPSQITNSIANSRQEIEASG